MTDSAEWWKLPEPPSEAEQAEMRADALRQLLPHTLPADAPGAWIRAAITAELDGAES